VIGDGVSGTNLFFSAVRDDQSKAVILKVVNAASRPMPAVIALTGVTHRAHPVEATVLTSDNLFDENSFDQPRKVAPVTSSLGHVHSRLRYTFEPHSLTVLRIGAISE